MTDVLELELEGFKLLDKVRIKISKEKGYIDAMEAYSNGFAWMNVHYKAADGSAQSQYLCPHQIEHWPKPRVRRPRLRPMSGG